MGCILQSQYRARPRALPWCPLSIKCHGRKDQAPPKGDFFPPPHAVGCPWQASHKASGLYEGWQTFSCKRRRCTGEALVSVRAHP